MAKSISDKVDIKAKIIISHKKRHFRMIKDSIRQEDITILNMYALILPQKIRGKIWHEEKPDKNTIRNKHNIVMTDFDISFSATDGTRRKNQ